MRKYLLIILSLFLLGTNKSLAYNDSVVHPGITKEAINLYLNSGNQGKISKSEIKLIVKGSIEEDTDPRYANHFYNPYNNKSLLEAFGKALPTAREWAFRQTSLTGDYSVPAILDNYRQGEKRRAFEGVGRILHLIQDMGVPAHVRVDPHLPGNADGYETFTKENTNFFGVKTTYAKNDIDNIFDGFASYTIDNYYSDERIDNLIKIEEIKRIKEKDGVVYDYGIKDGKIVCRVKVEKKLNTCFLTKYVYKYYWQSLYPKAVTHSASALSWFMDEFEKIDNEKKELSFWNKAFNSIVKAPSNIMNSTRYFLGDNYLAMKDGVVMNIKGAWYFAGATGNAVYYSGMALDSLSEKAIKSTTEIVKTGTINTISSIGEASNLGGLLIEGSFKTAEDTTGRVLDAFEEVGSVIKKTTTQILEVVENAEKKLKEKKTEQLKEDKNIFNKEETREVIINPETAFVIPGEGVDWQSRQNILLFSGGSLPTKEEERELNDVQDLSLIEFSLYSLITNDKESTSSTTVGVNIDKKDLNNLKYYLSESAPDEEIAWAESIPERFTLSPDAGEKTVYLYVSDEKNLIIFKSSIYLQTKDAIIEIISGPEYYSSSTEASFLLRADSPPELFEYSFNGEEFLVSDLSSSISEGIVFPEAYNILNIRIRDKFGRIGTTSYEWIVDTRAPVVSFEEAEIVEDGIVLNWLLENEDNNSSPVKHFELEIYLDDEFLEYHKFESDVFSFSLSNQENLSFRIRAIDMAFNIGDWSSLKTEEEKIKNVLISEIGIRDKEFIELYNPNKEDISMDGWYITYYYKNYNWNTPYKYLSLDGEIIKANSYYLISAKEDNFEFYDNYFSFNLNDYDGSVGIFSSDPRISSSSEAKSYKIDVVGWGSPQYVYEGAPIKIQSKTKSIERKARASSTKESMEEAFSDKFFGNAYDSDNNSDDFVLTESPFPQGSYSLSEPREPIIPSSPTDFSLKDGGLAHYSVELQWTESESYKREGESFYEMRYMEGEVECNFEDESKEYKTVNKTILPEISGEDIRREIYLDFFVPNTDYCFALRVFNGETWSPWAEVNFKTLFTEAKELTNLPIHMRYVTATRLTKENSPYFLSTMAIVGSRGLIIEPGVVIKVYEFYMNNMNSFPNYLNAEGPIIAIGTKEEPIIFTTIHDDSVDGDSNNNGSNTIPGKGVYGRSWGGLILRHAGNIFDNVIIKYAGGNHIYKNNIISIHSPDTIITNSIFENNNRGINVAYFSTSTQAVITNNTFLRTDGGITLGGNANPVLENNVFK